MESAFSALSVLSTKDRDPNQLGLQSMTSVKNCLDLIIFEQHRSQQGRRFALKIGTYCKETGEKIKIIFFLNKPPF